ncbi:hypothetical protein [Mycobacteroides abscessus]|uniref:Secreted peptide n=1 Tax=Mycobacteroides abscessus subsp. abscessus TaxID=1185650 RepID=A0AB38CXE0_9MYCO|nr:hypothetical protein [Mycobacteroides abscessus]AKP57455.1 hypothetical protein MAUC22_07115 [Mycobacteroides abscessus UC22]AMU54872.1 hypothetical protein A3O02_06540 [Mycobacteroides abscessus]AMU64974.1 hypothetical protein A3O04_06525 [Mycobacteroides abscessus]ANO13534.1 hypothetical protein BAB77_06405 [Mycobacteroides abscessus]MBE5405532.1 hypothetical protein [Mycobacteroides abscessus]
MAGLLLVLVVVGGVLLNDEDELDKVEIDSVAGSPWIPSWAQPATIAVKVTTAAIHFILTVRVFLTCQRVVGGG